jgi:hypothetical protein
MTSLRHRVAGFFSTAHRDAVPDGAVDDLPARYAPEIDGEADPGEVVWAWVPYEDDPTQGKDRPVLLLDTDGDGWVGLMLSSQDHDRDAEDEARHGRHWMDVGTGGWDREGRPSEVRLDRLIRLEADDVRREGAALEETIFHDVVEAWRGLDR